MTPRIEAARCTKCKHLRSKVYICPICDKDKVFVPRSLLAEVCDIAGERTKEAQAAYKYAYRGHERQSDLDSFESELATIEKARGLINPEI